MTDPQRHALLLVGSPRTPSNSEALGQYLLDRLAEAGLTTSSLRIPLRPTPQATEKLIAQTDQADLLILAFPLYVDSLPASVIRAAEQIAQHRGSTDSPKAQRLVAIVNCGFPEAAHTELALAMCRRFAAAAGLDWAAGLGVGGGEMLGRKSLQDAGGAVRSFRKALDEIAAEITRGDPAVADRFVQPPIPAWLYRWGATRYWKRQAREHGVMNQLQDRPYRTPD
jgi:hypothetical protein